MNDDANGGFFERMRPGPDHECPADALDAKAAENWARLPEEIRKAGLDVLRPRVPAEMLTGWRDQLARGVRVGSDDPWFHHGVGMAVRNTLRAVLTDDKLPPVEYPDGHSFRNWDDFYGGALQELAAEPAPEPAEPLIAA